MKSRIGTEDYLTSHSATNSPVPPALGSTSFSLDRTFTPPTITSSSHDTHPVCLSLSTPDFQVHANDWTSTNNRTSILENGHPVNEENANFDPSMLETIHSEGNTPQSSASHEELLSSLQAASELLEPSSPNPGRVIHSKRSNKLDDDIIETRPSLQTAGQTRRPYPAEMQPRKSLSLPHFSRKNNVHLQQRPTSGDYDGQEALFEDLMGSSSDLGLPDLSQVLPEDGSAPSPSFSRAVKAALFGKVDFGHAFSQTQTASVSKNHPRRAGRPPHRYEDGVHRLVTEDESQTPKASPATQHVKTRD